MRPVSITIERFGSFIERQTFTFPIRPGLYFMQGRNDAEPKLGSNGSGKSTLWKALTWCVFGKDSRGLKAGDVANWEAPKGASVSFLFEFDSSQYEVKRTHAPNAWLLSADGEEWHDLAKDETNPLADMLRLEYEAWLMTVLMAQGEPYFLDLRAEAKAALFSEVMGLDRWLEYSQRAATLLTAKAADVIRQEQDLAHIEGRLSGMRDEEYAEQSAGWIAQRDARIAELTLTHERGIEVSKVLKERLQLAQEDANLAHERTKGQQAFIDKKMAKLEEYTALYQSRTAEHVRVTEQARNLSEQHQQLVGAKVCPLCGQSGHLENVRIDLRASWLAVNSAVELAAAAVARVSQDVAIMRDGVQKAQNDAQQALRGVDIAQRALSGARAAYEAQEKELDRLEDEAARLDQDGNPFEAPIARVAAERRELEGRRDRAEIWSAASAEHAARLGFWIRGFKDLRLQLISEALDHYAIEANSCAQQLGLSGWELVFEVDRETKSGSIRSGFNVYVKSPHNDRQVPWEAWSGGEAQRLRLAAQLGLSNHVRATTGADIALEVWDEATDGMSDQGVTDLLDALADRARVEQRQIWVVDHRVLGYSGWDGTVTVIKGKNGSRFDASADTLASQN